MASPRGYHDLLERRFMSASGTSATLAGDESRFWVRFGLR